MNQPSITVGPFVLRRDGGQLLAEHAALRQPMQVSEAQLQRWLMRQARESLTIGELGSASAPAKEPAA